jgi:hypothetical protein
MGQTLVLLRYGSHFTPLANVALVMQEILHEFPVEMKLELWCSLWKLRLLKNQEITSPLKSGPHSAQPLIFNIPQH